MKKLLFIITILAFSFGSSAQKVTYSAKRLQGLPEQGAKVQNNYVTYNYVGSSSDLLYDNTDTIQLQFIVNKPWAAKYYASFTVDTIAGADTTLKVTVYGKMFADQSYSSIESTTTSAVSASTMFAIESLTDPTYSTSFGADSTTTVTPVITPYYRYLMFEISPVGDDATGGGIELEDLKLFLPESL